MNKIYKVIWSKTRNCYVAVSELARNHGKGNVRSEKRGIAKGASVLALSIALSLGVTGSAWAEVIEEDTTVKGNLTVASTAGDSPIGGDLTVSGKTTTGSLEAADGAIVLGADGSITAGTINANNLILTGPVTLSSLNLNIGTGNTVSGDYSAAVGENNSASGTDSVAVGSGTEAFGNYSFAGGGNVLRTITTWWSGRKEETITTHEDAVSKALGEHSFAFGYGVQAGDIDTLDYAGRAFTSQDGSWIVNGYAAAFGYETKANRQGTFAAGYKTNAGTGTLTYNSEHTTILHHEGYKRQIGTFDFNQGRYAAAFGEDTTAAGRGAVAFGKGADFSEYFWWNGGSPSGLDPDPNHYYRPNSGKTGAYGLYSATFGYGTFAMGERAVAMGSRTNALGDNSLAWGFQSYAVGKDSTAFGNNTMALGNRSTAFGSQTEAAAQDSLSFGIDTKAYGKRSTAFGSHTLATGDKATSFGTSTTAQSENSTAFGERAQASGKNSLAFGHYSTTGVRYQSEQDKRDGIYTMTPGTPNSYVDSPYLPHSYNPIKVKVEDKQFAWVLTDNNDNAVKATIDGKEYVVYHAHTNTYINPETGKIARDPESGEPYSTIADGRPVYAIKYREYDEAGNPGDYYYQEVTYDPTTGKAVLFEEVISDPETGEEKRYVNKVKVGDADSVWKLSLTDLGNEDDDALYERGKTPLFQYVMDPSSSAKNAVAFGNDTNAQADNSLAFGDANIAGGKRSTAFGNHTEATGDSATSFGDNTLASARNATAFGESSRATKQNATTFGQENATLAKNATAWGHKTKATGEASTAYGDKSLAAGKYATSFGEGSVSFAQDSVSWGSKAVAGISMKDADYQAYMGMIDTLANKEEELKAARKAGDIAETARLTSDIADYEGQIATFYKNRFSVPDQAAADALNQQTADALNQQTVSNLNQQKASEINMANLTEYCSEVEIPNSITYQNQQIARQLGKRVEELTDDERFTIDKLAASFNEYIAYTLGKSVEDLTDDEKATAENLASKMAETMPVDYQMQVLGDNFMTEDNLPDDQKMTVDKLPDDQKMTAENLPDDQKAVAKNMGKNSTAWGQNTNAFGRAATAWGNKTVAAGANSTAWGNQSIAVGGDSTALGKGSKAWGDNSLAALGGTTGKGSEGDEGYTVETNAVGAIAMGVGAQAQKSYTYAIGNKAKATADNTMAFGNGAGASGIAAIAIGTNAVASGEQSISVGYGNEVTGAHSGAFGDPNKVYGSNSYAAGNNNTIGTKGSTDVGNNSFVVGNNVSTTSNYVVALGDGTSVTKDYSVALGAASVAQRDNENGGAGAGYDVTTGTNYAGDGADSPTWVSTLAAVSVGGTADDTDAEIGTAATATRQITGVAAGTADTDAVNVAQLRLAKLKTIVRSPDGSVIITAPDGETLDEPNAEGVITYNLKVNTAGGPGGADGDTTYTFNDTTEVAQADDPSIVQQTTVIQNNPDGSTTTVATLNDTDTTYSTNVTTEGLEDGQVSKLTITNNVTETPIGEFFDTDTNTHAIVVGKGAVTVTTIKDATATEGPTYEVSLNTELAGGTTYTAEQSVTGGEGPEEGSTTFNITDDNTGESAGSMTINAGKNVTITEEKDENNNSIAVINAENTTYAGEQTTEEGEGPGEGSTTFTLSGSDGSRSRMNIQAGDNITITKTRDAAVIKAVNTTYKFETDRKKEGTVAATFTVTNEQTGEKVGEFQDTHNGLKNDTNKVKYDKNGEGSVTITDQDGNTTTITGIRDSGGEALNRLGDQITRMDSKIEKVGAGAAALAGLHPLDFDPDEKWDFAAAVGSYKSEQAVAIGAFYRPNEDTMFSIGGTVGNGNNMVNVGVSWKFGQKNRISANRISSAKEIIELRKNQEDVHSFLADAVAGNQLDLSKIQLFPDVEENHWAYDYVATMAGNGVLEGYPDGYFKGNRNMTRYEMAAVLYRLMQNGARLSDKALTEFAPELDRIRVDTITKHKDGTPHIQRVRTIKERVDEKADLSSEEDTKKKKAKIKVAEKPVE